MQSKATTVEAYLAELPEDRRAAIRAVRAVILKNLDKDFREGMQYGMIGYHVPHSIFPQGYHCDPKQPLPFAGLASQKNSMSLYVMSVYADAGEESWVRAQFERAGKRLDMGKCCIRFKRLEDLPLDVVGEMIRRVPAKAHIAYYLSTMDTRSRVGAVAAAAKQKGVKKKAAAKKTASKKKSTKKKASGRAAGRGSLRG